MSSKSRSGSRQDNNAAVTVEQEAVQQEAVQQEAVQQEAVQQEAVQQEADKGKGKGKGKESETIAVMTENERNVLGALVSHKLVFEAYLRTSDTAYVDMLRSLAVVVKDARESWSIYHRAKKWHPTDMKRFEDVFPSFVGAKSCDDAIDGYLTGDPINRSLSWFKRASKILAHPVLLDHIDGIGVGRCEQMAAEFAEVISESMVAIAANLKIKDIPNDSDLWAAYYDAKREYFADLHASALGDTSKAHLAQSYMNKANDANKTRLAIESGAMNIVKGKLTPVVAEPEPGSESVVAEPEPGSESVVAEPEHSANPAVGKLSLEERQKQLMAYYSPMTESALRAALDSVWSQLDKSQQVWVLVQSASLLEYDKKELS